MTELSGRAVAGDTQVEDEQVRVVVRLFAGARAAAGTAELAVTAPAGASVATVLDTVVATRPGLARVLPACSVLLDGVVAPPERRLGTAPAGLDVLPPFSGG